MQDLRQSLRELEKGDKRFAELSDQVKSQERSTEDTLSKLQQNLVDGISQEQRSREADVASLKELIANNRSSLDELIVGERNARETNQQETHGYLELNRTGLVTQSSSHAALEERVKFLEGLLQDFVDKHAALSNDIENKQAA